ncbi:MAG: hypothetical protein RLZZ292_2702 [Bacteroidota bacterium]|jgi:uncharacterized protein (TIGR02646 family)
MRYVDKSNRSKEFDAFVAEISKKAHVWKDLKSTRNKAKIKGGDVQLALFQYLWQQQKGLCIYCQQQIAEKIATYKTVEEIIAHIEHICPQSVCTDKIFDQSNLVVSCEGFNLTELTPLQARRNFCGHRKANEYDISNFLNPTQIKNVESYFSYSALGKIEADFAKNEVEQEQANYMISILGLDNTTLETMRQNQYRVWTTYLNTFGEDWVKENLEPDFLELPAFYSMLKTKFL